MSTDIIQLLSETDGPCKVVRCAYVNYETVCQPDKTPLVVLKPHECVVLETADGKVWRVAQA